MLGTGRVFEKRRQQNMSSQKSSFVQAKSEVWKKGVLHLLDGLDTSSCTEASTAVEHKG